VKRRKGLDVLEPDDQARFKCLVLPLMRLSIWRAGCRRAYSPEIGLLIEGLTQTLVANASFPRLVKTPGAAKGL